MTYAGFVDFMYLQREKLSLLVGCLCVCWVAMFIIDSKQEMVLQPPEAPPAGAMVAMLALEQPALAEDLSPQEPTPAFPEISEPEPDIAPDPIEEKVPEPTPVVIPPKPVSAPKPKVTKPPVKPPKPIPKPVKVVQHEKKPAVEPDDTQVKPQDTTKAVQEKIATNTSSSRPETNQAEITSAAIEKSSTNYAAFVVGYLKKNQKYPTGRQASELSPKGTVTVWFIVNRAGEVLDYGIESSSRSQILDRAAKKLVRRAKFPPFPDDVFPSEANHRFIAHLKYEKK